MQRFEFFESPSLCTTEIQKPLSTHISSSYKKKSRNERNPFSLRNLSACNRQLKFWKNPWMKFYAVAIQLNPLPQEWTSAEYEVFGVNNTWVWKFWQTSLDRQGTFY